MGLAAATWCNRRPLLGPALPTTPRVTARIGRGGVANLNTGQRPTSANLQSTAITQAQAAEQLNVSPRSVASAKTMLTNGIPELVAEVERGDLAVSWRRPDSPPARG